ncbi:MAG: LutB/LldF family L-lactate oxidation iron-sulfur protein [Solirubrobacterales bacterium]
MKGPRSFPEAAREALADPTLRRNLGRATATIRARRAAVVAEKGDWQALRDAGAAIKADTMSRLDDLLEQFERQVELAGGTVHWAVDGTEACKIVAAIARDHDCSRLLKVKSMATDEIGLNASLAEAGIEAIETDLAELIVQLAGDRPSHILVPAIHRNRDEIHALFAEHLGAKPEETEPEALAAVARRHLRRQFMTTSMAVSGANFGVAETGAICVVESEGNGRMCTTLPDVLVTVMGIEKLIPRWQDLEVFLQLLPRSATGERMNPYTSFWTGVRTDLPGDGPREFHLVLLDNGRTRALADPHGRDALHCIRCSACLNVCPVYERVGGHAYEGVYPGPIGAVLAPQLEGVESRSSLPFASSLCGACLEACPVKIDIPSMLVHLRAAAVGAGATPRSERLTMAALARGFGSPRRFEILQRFGAAVQRRLPRDRRMARAPGPLGRWARSRDLPEAPPESFRAWWKKRRDGGG